MAALRTLQVRAKRGAELLDEKRPGWAKKIDTDKLRMESCAVCILGQLNAWAVAKGSYRFGMIGNGFARSSCLLDEYPTLTRLWKHHIKKRLAV